MKAPAKFAMRPAKERSWWAVLRRAEGTQLVEFALVLPLLLVLAVGGADFARAYNLKQKLTNAAREGARIAAHQTQADLQQTTPPSVQAVRNAVVVYLQNENLDGSLIAAAPSKTGPMEWTYASTASGDPLLVIDRGAVVPVTVDGSTVLAVSTRVTLRYPFQWSFPGFFRPSGTNQVLVPSEAVMRNLT